MVNRLSFLVLIGVLSNLASQQTWANASIETNMKEWTLLVFLNGNNNLDDFGAMNMKQMEQVGSTDDLNIVVQWASESRHQTQRLLILQDTTSKNVTSPVLQDLGADVDMGNWKSLVDFVKWGVANFPAKHYMIDIWDHGSGWHPMKTRSQFHSPRSRFTALDISWDDFTGNAITTRQLGQAMREAAQIIGHKVDLYASDACLMAMFEVAQEMADSVSIFGGSEEVEQGAGWPYDDFLRKWTQNGQSSASQVATFLSDSYVKSYNGGQYGNSAATYSVFDLAKLPAFNEKLRVFGTQLTTLDDNTRDQVIHAAAGSQHFTYSDYVDLNDFLNSIKGLTPLDPWKGSRTIAGQSLQDLQDALHDLIIAHGATPRYAKAFGGSIWLPTRFCQYQAHKDLYETLQFNSLTGWGSVLASLIPKGEDDCSDYSR